jgi:hypothetical protein
VTAAAADPAPRPLDSWVGEAAVWLVEFLLECAASLADDASGAETPRQRRIKGIALAVLVVVLGCVAWWTLG